MTTPGSAGTPSAGYLTTPAPHPWTPIPADPGERVRCEHCPQPRHAHMPPIPQQRSKETP